MKQPAVYIMASAQNGTLYVGVTSDLVARAWQHKQGAVAGFTRRHRCHKLVYFELYDDIVTAITREKQIKGGSREKKIALIEDQNSDWRDLYDELV